MKGGVALLVLGVIVISFIMLPVGWAVGTSVLALMLGVFVNSKISAEAHALTAPSTMYAFFTSTHQNSRGFRKEMNPMFSNVADIVLGKRENIHIAQGRHVYNYLSTDSMLNPDEIHEPIKSFDDEILMFDSSHKFTEYDDDLILYAVCTTSGKLFVWFAELSPVPIDLFGRKVVSISCGRSHIAAVCSDGTLWKSGLDADDDSDDDFYKFEQQLSDIKFKSVACGPLHMLALGVDGSVWAFYTIRELINHRINLPGKASAISCGEIRSAIVCDGKVYAGGLSRHITTDLYTTELGDFEEITDEDDDGILQPAITDKIVDISCGTHHVVALAADRRTIWTWGRNDKNQLGRKGTWWPPAPIKLKDIGICEKVIAGFDKTALLCRPPVSSSDLVSRETGMTRGTKRKRQMFFE